MGVGKRVGSVITVGDGDAVDAGVGARVGFAVTVADGDASDAGVGARVGFAVTVADGDTRGTGMGRVGVAPVAAGNKAVDVPPPVREVQLHGENCPATEQH